MKPESVLVTGAAGFIGSHVARHVAAMGHRVVALDDLSGGFEDNVPAQARFVRGSILDPGLLDRLFEAHRFGVVFHLAAYAAEGLSHYIRSFNYANNVVGSMNLVSRSLRGECRCFVFTSSIAVYGEGQVPMTEDLEPRPEDPYGIAKLTVEKDLQAARAMFGLPSVIFRPHNVYGEGQNVGDPFRNVVGIFMRQLLAGEPLTVFGDGSQSRAFSHVDDVAPLIARAPWTPGAENGTFNVGADQPCTVLELAERLGRVMGRPPVIRHLPARPEVRHAFSDHSRVRQVFQPGPAVPLDDGLRRMAEWLRRVGVRRTPWFPPVEVSRRLPDAWREIIRERPGEAPADQTRNRPS